MQFARLVQIGQRFGQLAGDVLKPVEIAADLARLAFRVSRVAHAGLFVGRVGQHLGRRWLTTRIGL